MKLEAWARGMDVFAMAYQLSAAVDFDKLHYEVENKLLRLIESLERKRGTNEWRDTLPPPPSSHTTIQSSSHAEPPG